MLNLLSEKELRLLPKLHETLDVPYQEKLVLMHFFQEGAEWFVVEYDPKERTFFGYADVRPGHPGWGYFSLDELLCQGGSSLNGEVERDISWNPRKAKEIENIVGTE